MKSHREVTFSFCYYFVKFLLYKTSYLTLLKFKSPQLIDVLAFSNHAKNYIFNVKL